MKRKIKNCSWVISMGLVFGFVLAGCMSMAVGLAKAQFKDYGVYDSSVPESQQCELRFMFVKVKTFDGKAVKWEGANANNSGHVKIPAGKHDIVFDWTMQQTQMTGVSSTTYTYETTTKSLKDITISPVFEAGHNYFIGGGQLADGSLKIYLQDMTNMPNEFYGDVVANAPKASKSPTEFEGAWKDNEGTTFVFAGNTWEQALPPGTSTNTGAQEVRLKGTFESANGKVTLYMTDTFAAGKWIKMTAMKSAYIYDYSFEGGDLLLELGGVLPKSRYIKQ